MVSDDRLREGTMGGGQRTVGTTDFFYGACLTYIEEHGLDPERIEAWEGTTFFALGVRGFAVMNLVLGAVWLTVAIRLVRRYGSLSGPQA